MIASEPVQHLRLNDHGRKVVRDILAGVRSHKDLKHAFDWENTPEGHAYWSRQRQSAELSNQARDTLSRALRAS